VCGSVLRRVAVCCSVVQCVAAAFVNFFDEWRSRASKNHAAPQYSTLLYTSTQFSTLQHAATHFNTLQHTATHCNTLQHTATHCITIFWISGAGAHPRCSQAELQQTATHCNTLQHAATHCNTLRHTATCCNTLQQIRFAVPQGAHSRSS